LELLRCYIEQVFVVIQSTSKRKLILLNIAIARYDRKRVQELGPDRACADWIIRCGGSVRFKNWGSFVSKRNQLPIGTPGHFRIEEIRVVQTCLTSEGFAYLDGLHDLKKIHLEKCDQIDDSMNLVFKRIGSCKH